MSDALHPDEVNTPFRRLYYAVQLILTKDESLENLQEDTKARFERLIKVFKDMPCEPGLIKAKNAFAAGRYYSVICGLKSMLKFEQELLFPKYKLAYDPSKDQAAMSLAG